MFQLVMDWSWLESILLPLYGFSLLTHMDLRYAHEKLELDQMEQEW